MSLNLVKSWLAFLAAAVKSGRVLVNPFITFGTVSKAPITPPIAAPGPPPINPPVAAKLPT